MSCDICAFVKVHDHYPSDGKSHCDRCHRSWRGHAESHCVECCRHFGGDTAFLAHRVGGICRDPSILKRKDKTPRFKPIMRKDGVVWVNSQEPREPKGAVARAAGRVAARVERGLRVVVNLTRNEPSSEQMEFDL